MTLVSRDANELRGNASAQAARERDQLDRVEWSDNRMSGLGGDSPGGLSPRLLRLFMTKLFSLGALLGILVAFIAPSSARAQAAVTNSTSPPPASSPSPGRDEMATPALPSVEEMDQMFKQTPLGTAADEVRLHAQWRELSNRTANDQDLVAMRGHAEATSTDLEKRKRLRTYYATYFDRMKARAATQELKDYVDARKADQIGLLAQDRVRPGSTPVPSPGTTPVPSATPKKKHKKHNSAFEPSLPQ
ncbi:MAG: hypothetical protein ACR2MF_09795 [Chthoniobacterales bacterium]